MLYQSLHILVRLLNDHLVNKFNQQNQRVTLLSPIVNQDGTIPEHAINKIVLTLVKLEQDKNIRIPVRSDSTSLTVSGFNNLYVLVSAVFEANNYDEGLKFLDESLIFFLQQPVFNSTNTHELDTKISQIRVTPVELSIDDNNRLWAMLGAKYMPSVLFLVQVQPAA